MVLRASADSHDIYFRVKGGEELGLINFVLWWNSNAVFGNREEEEEEWTRIFLGRNRNGRWINSSIPDTMDGKCFGVGMDKGESPVPPMQRTGQGGDGQGRKSSTPNKKNRDHVL